MKIILTTGDPNGIGIEILAKALLSVRRDKLFEDIDFTIAGNENILKDYFAVTSFDGYIRGGRLRINDLDCRILHCQNYYKIKPGDESAEGGAAAAKSIETALEKTIAGDFDALVTMPISKAAVYKAGWKFPGHTEMLASRCGVEKPMMILCTQKIRVALATIHTPISRVPEMISRETVFERIEAFNKSLLKDFGIKKPKIAVLGLNPHAGEGGGLGSEENEHISPAIKMAVRKGTEAEGPHPADGFFARGAYKRYDGILAMYHDQGLIPLKMLAAGAGVNFTAGLPIVRTSPDHGSAFAIAGKGIAEERSAVEAVKMSVNIFRNRR